MLRQQMLKLIPATTACWFLYPSDICLCSLFVFVKTNTKTNYGNWEFNGEADAAISFYKKRMKFCMLWNGTWNPEEQSVVFKLKCFV